jgi:hypothetical protein
VVASGAYRRRADGIADADEGRGVQFEAGVLRDLVMGDRRAWSKRILTVLLPGATVDNIPQFLGPYSRRDPVMGTCAAKRRVENAPRARSGTARIDRGPGRRRSGRVRPRQRRALPSPAGARPTTATRRTHRRTWAVHSDARDGAPHDSPAPGQILDGVDSADRKHSRQRGSIHSALQWTSWTRDVASVSHWA